MDAIFAKGEAFVVYPIKAVVLFDQPTTMAMFSVPKRALKKAVWRNVVRRRIKEAYRLNYIQNVSVVWIFIGKGVTNYNDIEDAIRTISQKIGDRATCDPS